MQNWEKATRLFTKIGVSLFVLIFAAILITGDNPGDYVKWSFGMIGVVVGYWLK